MSAQQTIYDRIKKDLKDDKILQNVTLERLWYYFESIKDITGSGGASFTNGTGAPSGGADGDYYIRTDNPQAIYYNNAGTWEIALVAGMNPATYDPQSFTDACLFGFQEIAVEDAQYMVDHNIVWNLRDQPIKIVSNTTVLPTGINHILTKIIFNPSNQYRFDNVCQAWVTALGRYVPCTYDVATNKIQTKFPLFCFTASQSGTSAPTIDTIYINGFGITPTPSYVEVGEYLFTVTGLLAGISIPDISHITSDGLTLIRVFKTDNDSFSVANMNITSQNREDNILGGNYIEVEGIISNL